MSKTLQFRCPLCNRLLIKWEIGTTKCIYDVTNLTKEGKTRCTKCNSLLIFKGNQFVADVETQAAPLNNSGPANHISDTHLGGPQKEE